MPVDNGSSLNVPITIKIIALANVTVIETSVLALYLLVHYLILIFSSYAPLPGDSKFACHPCKFSKKFPQMTKFNRNFFPLLSV